MYKKILIFVAVITIMAFLSGCNKPTLLGSEEISFESQVEDVKFTLTYNSLWSEMDFDLENTVFKIGRDDTTRVHIKRYNVFSLTQEEYNELTLEDEFISDFESNEYIKDVEVEPAIINGINTNKFTYIETVEADNLITNKTDYLEAKTMTFFFIKEDIMLAVNYVSSPETFDNYLEEAEEIISTFEWK
jgi:hypothetical protein